MDIIESTELTRKYVGWSSSKADTAAQCAMRFNRQYVQKVREGLPRKNSDALVGTAVHSIVEIVLAGRKVTGAMNSVLRDSALTNDEVDRITAYAPNIEKFLKRYKIYTQKHACKIPLLEKKLGVTITGKATPYFGKDLFLRGVLDLCLLFKDNKTAVIIDHKTGGTRDLSYYTKQFDSYVLLMKANYPELQKIKIGINFLKEGILPFSKGVIDVTDIEPLLNKVINNINSASANLTDLDKTTVSKLCNWCSYKHICPAHQGGNVSCGSTKAENSTTV